MANARQTYNNYSLCGKLGRLNEYIISGGGNIKKQCCEIIEFAICHRYQDVKFLPMSIDNNFIFRHAAEFGHIEIMRYLAIAGNVDLAANCAESFIYAAAIGNKDILIYLISVGSEFIGKKCANDAFNHALHGAHICAVKYIYSLYNAHWRQKYYVPL
jgi:hypothetical protein